MTDNLHTLAAPYVIDALDPEEREAFEAHLDQCPDCRDEVASLAVATEALADSHAMAAPASLHSRVMAEVARTPQLPPLLDESARGATSTPAPSTPAAPTPPATAPAAPSPAPAAPSPAAPSTGAPATSSPDVIPLSRRSHGARRWWIAAPVAAVTAAVLVVGGVMVSDARSDRAEQLALENEALSVASAEDMEAVSMDLGSGKVMISAEMDSVAIMGTDAPSPEDGKEYQLWLVMDDGTIEAGPTFVPREDGVYMSVSDADVARVAAVAFTEEPEGGSEAPTMDPFAVTEMPVAEA